MQVINDIYLLNAKDLYSDILKFRVCNVPCTADELEGIEYLIPKDNDGKTEYIFNVMETLFFSRECIDDIKRLYTEEQYERIEAYTNLLDTKEEITLCLLKKAGEVDAEAFKNANGNEITDANDEVISMDKKKSWIIAYDSDDGDIAERLENSICFELGSAKEKPAFNVFEVDDILYLYEKGNKNRITHRCIVNRIGRLEIQVLKEFDERKELSLESIEKNGFKYDFSFFNCLVPVQASKGFADYLENLTQIQDESDNETGNNLRLVGPSIEREMIKHDELISCVGDDDMILKLARKNRSIYVKSYVIEETKDSFDVCIAEYAYRRADGKCQLCGNPAPFNDENGKPYLELYHIDDQINDGDDSIENVAALCPNCHMKMKLVHDENDTLFLKGKAVKLDI